MDTKERNALSKNSIMQKITYGILVPLVVILVITGVILNFRLTNEIESLQENTLQAETESAIGLVDRYFGKYFSIIETTASLPLVQEALQEISQNGESFLESPYHDEIIETLKEIQKLSPDAIQSLYIADFTTSQYLRWDGKTPENGWDITTRPYYSLVNEAKSTILTSVFQNVAELTVVSVSTPVFRSGTDEILGIVNIDLGIDSLIESMNAITVGNEGHVMVLDSANEIISARDNAILLKNVEEVGFSDELVTMVLNHETGSLEFQFEDISYYANVGFVDYLSGWCVLGVMPDSEYHKPIFNVTLVVIACFCICIVVLSVLCVKIVLRMIWPLKELSRIVGEIAEGNLYVSCDIIRNDEIGRLAEGFRVMVKKLQETMQYLNESYEKLEHQAYIDALTNIGNRKAFNEKMKEYDQRNRIACVVADVNNLKLCNDKYGHSEGDKIIIDAADCIRGAFDSIGSCYRIGGDEFCVLCPDCGKAEVLSALEQAKQLIEEANQNRKMPLSIAFGYAVRMGIAESMEELFNRGDEMMYHVKNQMKKDLRI